MSGEEPEAEKAAAARRIHEIDLFASTRVRLSPETTLAELRDDLVRASYQRRQVTLTSGVKQPYYFDKYLIIARPAILRRLGRLLAARVPNGTDRVAAPTLGAVAVGAAVSLETGLPLLIVRTHVDEDRPVSAVEGGLHEGESVCLVEDVVVTGTRAMSAIRRLSVAGARVGSVVCILDCERGAADRLAGAAVEYLPLFRYSSFILAADTS